MYERKITMEEQNSLPEPEPVEEMSFTDKVVGVISEAPSQFFAKYKLQRKTTADWLLPLVLYLLIFGVTQIVHFSNPDLVQDVKSKARKAALEQLEKEEISQAEKQQRTEQLEQQLQFIGTPIYHVITVISVFAMGFIGFFIVAGVLYFFVRVVYQDPLEFRDVMVANSVINYIGIIQLFVALIISFATSRIVLDTSLSSIFNIERTTLTGYLLYLVDFISLWILWVKGVALEQFAGAPKYRYRITVFGLWIVLMGVLYAIKDAFPGMGGF